MANNTTASDMIPITTPSMIDSLGKHDFAFVLRGDGKTWTYSIIANKTDDSILFVVDTFGSTKTLGRKYWLSRVRCVNTT